MGVIDVLKPHNLEAFQEINKLLASGIKKIAVPRATGSGKTYLMGALAEKYNSDKKLVLEPTRPLLNSIKEKFDEFGIENTDFMTYQKLIRLSDEDIAAMDYKLIFLDEAHHGTAPKWGQKIDHLMETHSDSIICGTSATTVRNDGVNVVESLFEGNAIGELPLSTAIARKVLPCPHYITAIYRLDDEFEKLKRRIEASTNTKEEKREFYEKMKTMQTHFEKSYGIPTILNKYIKIRNGRYLVFCKNRKHLDTMRDVVIDWFKTSGIKDIHSYAVYSDYPDKEKDYKEFCEDNSGALKILFSINMLNEGLHIEDISGVLMLRTTQSNTIYLQQLGRLIDADNMDKYLLVFDFVNNFSSVNDGIGLLREIKDAVAKKKESDPDFDDSGFEDIDTFFVLENVVQIKEMFAEIEGKLQGSWDLYIKALKQYKEREGDCLVPHNYVEVVDSVKVCLGRWVQSMRTTKKGKGRGLLTEKGKLELDNLGFIWDENKYKYEQNVNSCIEFYRANGRKPSEYSEDEHERKIGMFLSRNSTPSNISKLPKWKMDLLAKIPSLFEKKISRFDKFTEMAELFKKKNGHLNIKSNDIIDGYKIGQNYFDLVKYYKSNKITNDQIRKLKDVGIDIDIGKNEKLFKEKMLLVRQAVSEGVVLNSSNRIYKGVNLYNWKQSHLKDFSNEELKVMNSLVPSLRTPIKVEDIQLSKTYFFESIYEAGKALHNEFHVTDSDKKGQAVIHARLTKRTKNPIYRGRFRFEYVNS